MPFIRLPGLKGKVFVPEADAGGRKKYPCKDCHSCQMCGEERCAVCRSQNHLKVKRCECEPKRKER